MSEPELSKFEQALAERRRKKQETEQFQRIRDATYANDLVPDVQFERKPEDDLIDSVLGKVGIVEAYTKWCGKMVPKKRSGQTEGVMISCPIPGHKDSNPSAWANTEKNTWFCGTCNIGGDVFDIAAYRFGYPVPGYKTGANFHELRRTMVKDLGYVVQRSADPSIPDNIYLPSTPEALAKLTEETAITEPAPEQTVIEDLGNRVEAVNEDEDLAWIAPSFDWRTVVTRDTFIDKYMEATTVDDAPEEYHFWNALLCLGVAVGRDVTLQDLKPVYANIMLCILGQSGDRKSRSLNYARDLIAKALPWDATQDFPLGVRTVQGAASGEAVIAAFTKPVYDPVKMKDIIAYAPVRALVEYSELADLISRSSRQGSVIKTVLMQVADTDRSISTVSVTRGEVKAQEPFGCVTTSTQPESLRDLLTTGDTTSGFLNRWIFASGKSKRKVAIGGATVDTSGCIEPLQKIHGQPRRVITWSQEAYDKFTSHFHDKIEPAQRGNPILARLDLIEKKLILLFCINEHLNEVPGYIVDRVISMHGYLTAVYGVTSARITQTSKAGEIHEEIIRHVQRLTEDKDRYPYGPTKKNINDRMIRKNYDPLLVGRIFELLAKDERIEINQGDPNKPGRKTDHFRWLG